MVCTPGYELACVPQQGWVADLGSRPVHAAEPSSVHELRAFVVFNDPERHTQPPLSRRTIKWHRPSKPRPWKLSRHNCAACALHDFFHNIILSRCHLFIPCFADTIAGPRPRPAGLLSAASQEVSEPSRCLRGCSQYTIERIS